MRKNIKKVVRGTVITGALLMFTVASVFGDGFNHTYRARLTFDNKYDYIGEIKQNRYDFVYFAVGMYWNPSVKVSGADYYASFLINGSYVKGASAYIKDGNDNIIAPYISKDETTKINASRQIETDFVYMRGNMKYVVHWHWFK